MKEWMKHNHEELYKQSSQTLLYLEGKFGDWGINGKSAEWINTIVKPAHRENSDSFLAWQNESERTPAKTATLKRTEAVFIPLYRELYKFLTGNPLVLDEDLVKMGFPERPSGKRTPAPVPVSFPVASVNIGTIRQLTLDFVDSVTGKRGKPNGVAGAVIR